MIKCHIKAYLKGIIIEVYKQIGRKFGNRNWFSNQMKGTNTSSHGQNFLLVEMVPTLEIWASIIILTSGLIGLLFALIQRNKVAKVV